MKKKGFTLIELLAVIVVLAIIALIATPIVMNTIKKAKQGAAERSADNYIGAVETAIATAKLDSDRTFYVLEATGDNVSLIMDRNFTDEYDIVSETLAWCTDDGRNNTTCENINSKEQMPLTYIQNTFDIFDIDISFPTFDQVYKAAGNKNSELPMWLYDYLDGTPNSISGVYGYWTSSPNSDYTNSAVSVSYDGVIHTNSVNNSSENGVRPVITLSKSQLN